MKSQKQNKNPINIILIMIIVACVIGIGALIFSKSYFATENQVQREIEALAADYYENYLYENYFLKIPEADRRAEFEQYLGRGMNPVYLREILNYSKDKHSESVKIFQTARCDTNSTSVKYFPEEPYGRSDFRVEYKLSCEELENE
ncbi:MAG: hypothetical protein Q4F60_03210 [Candidatus Saccharibacteria bacterium]|nr:hypothetical protein [Candidatus Saccharibacteria bacterium]